MGLESICRAEIAGERVDGKLLIEGDELILRGERSRKFKLASLTNLRAVGKTLSATTKDGDLCFRLEGDADKWLKKIRNPPTRESKLGIKTGKSVCLLGTFDAAFEKSVAPFRTDDERRADLILLAAESKADLKSAKSLRARMKSDAAIWVIYPKGVQAIRQIEVIDALRGHGLKDIKVMSFSPSHTGLKFVIPVEERS